MGRTRRKKIPYSVAPSTLSASTMSFGIPCRYCLKKKIVVTCAKNGSMTPQMLSNSPMVLAWEYMGSMRISKGIISMRSKQAKMRSLPLNWYMAKP